MKTGGKGITGKWAREASERLGIGLEDVVAVGGGRATLAESFAKAAELSKTLSKFGANHAIVATTVLLAYEEAKAKGMDEKTAIAYAASAVVCGDLAHDISKAAINEAAAQIKDFASGSAAGQHIQATSDAANDKNQNDAKDTSKLDAWFDQQMDRGQSNKDYKPPENLDH